MAVMAGSTSLVCAQNKLKFTYDTFTGNQIVRELCLGCLSAKSVKDFEDLTQDDLLKFNSEDVISYYPNPVKEELYLNWELTEENYVQLVQLIGVTGQTLSSYEIKKNTNSQNIPFQNLPTGVYIVALQYFSGERKTIKIIKK